MPTYLFLRRLRRSPAAFSGLTLVILLVLTALFAPWLAPHDPNWQDAAARLQGPGAGHWLGTDSYGRDLLSRLLYGARPALGLVALVTAITLPVGLLVGILSGYYGGWLERILMRFTDVVMSMPRLILAFAFVAMLGPGLVNGALALALTTWPAYARQARSEIQRLRHSDYLAAAEMLGIRGGRLLVGHILPLCLPSAIVRLALDLAGIILAAAGLGFLGLGARPPMAEWGAMIADGMQVIFDQWWIAAIPGAGAAERDAPLHPHPVDLPAKCPHLRPDAADPRQNPGLYGDSPWRSLIFRIYRLHSARRRRSPPPVSVSTPGKPSA